MTPAEHIVTDERLAEIIKGCEGVTPGPWGEGDKWVFASPRSGNPSHALEHIFRNEEAQANAAHVARLDPQTVLSLLTELQHRRAEEASGVKAPDIDMALHWIDRYAAGIDEEPQMSRILDALGVSALGEQP